MEEKEQLTPQAENTAAEVAPKPAENVSPATEEGAVSAVAAPAAEAVTPETKVEEKAEAPKAEAPATKVEEKTATAESPQWLKKQLPKSLKQRNNLLRLLLLLHVQHALLLHVQRQNQQNLQRMR